MQIMSTRALPGGSFLLSTRALPGGSFLLNIGLAWQSAADGQNA